MVWGGNDGAVDRWVKQLNENDPKLTSLHILSFRHITTHELTRIFNAIAHNTILQNLYISGHQLDATSIEALSESLTLNETLKSLNIGHAAFGQRPDLFSIFCEGLAVNEGLELLDFENKALNYESVKLLADALAKNQHLSEINLARNELNDDSIATLAPSLSKLTKVNLSMNKIGVKGAEALACHVLGNAASQVQELDISENPLLEGAAMLATALGHNKHLHVLKMVNVVSPDEDTLLPPPALSNSELSEQPQETNQEFSIYGNALMQAIGQSLITNRHLTHLWLDNNSIESKALDTLVTHLDNSALIELNLRQNLIDDNGAYMLANTTTLQHLELGQNQITAKGFGKLLDHSSLQYLGLFSNTVGGFANDELPELITSRVHRLDIGCNGIVHEDLKAIAQVLINGGVPELRLLEMGGNVEDKELELWEKTMEDILKQRQKLEIIWKRKPSQMENQQAPPNIM
ncbi:uncharacterized protein BX663DRAFT_12874 [Cokeromyces recurvatus]|uniref:uncharacterized protein n=1 Tax=Cokeromyces recurvatus TaxID=90255 RepID=UPI00221FDA14|nr:uncharacterized protein BX663DRAFT_12874 [Cokeromyces recurvatus]KAI7907857.1 hypothetical protein BX663DRAFT_12874 [Cokeromyces recurvatus]